MKTLFSALFVIAIFSALASSFISPASDIISTEKRKRVEFPVFDEKHNLKEYFGQIDGFAKDNFPLRDHLISGYRWMVNLSGDTINADKAFRGRDGWLFMGNHFRQTIDKLEGTITPDAEHSWTLDKIIPLARWFQQNGVKVVFVLGPDKHSIYPEKLPAIITPSPVRYVKPFLERLRNSGIEVVDPTEALIARKNRDIVYWKHDGHWNQIGASVAFTEGVNVLGIQDCPSPQFEASGVRKGDLIDIGMFEMPSKSNDNFRTVWEQPDQRSTQIIDDPEVTMKHDRTKIINNPHPAHENAIFLIGDSFRGGMEEFVSMCFARTHSIHIYQNSTKKIQAAYEAAPIKPSYVMIVIVERQF